MLVVHQYLELEINHSDFSVADVAQEVTEDRGGDSYEYEGVRVAVINGDKHICNAEGCSKFFVGTTSRQRVIEHIKRSHLRKKLKSKHRKSN